MLSSQWPRGTANYAYVCGVICNDCINYFLLICPDFLSKLNQLQLNAHFTNDS